MKLFENIINAVQGDDSADMMSREQRMKESGDRQFGADGKPLVGRYRDGSTPKPGKEAYGTSQMQIGTARNVAKAHGIAWDEKKFLNDKAYNATLGDKHMADLRVKYGGDERLAQGAYHSGEPNVDRAIARYGRSNFTQGLGPEGRAYVAKIGGGSTQGGRSVAQRPSNVKPALDLSSIIASEGQVQAMGVDKVIGDPDAAGARIDSAATEQTKRASIADQVLTAAVAKSDAVRTQQMDALAKTVEAKKGLNEHQRTTTEAVIERVTPIFQKRQAIADRRVEVGNMNPFVAAIKGAFDPNYNGDYLDGMDAALTRQAGVMTEAHDTDMKLHQTLAALATADFNDQDSIFKLQLANYGQDVVNAVQSFEAQHRILATEIDGLQANTAVVAARTTARNDIMSGLTDGQINESIKRAELAPDGTTAVNGITLRLPDLQALRQNRQEQLYQLESRQLAIESNRMEMADRAEDKIMETMTDSEVKTAIANNGVFKGQQLDVTKLGGRLVALQKTQEALVAGQLQQDAAGTAKSMMMGLADRTKIQSDRIIGIFGRIPDEYAGFSRTMTAQIQSFVKGMKNAEAQGTKEEYVAANAPMVQALIQAQDATIDGIVKRWSGGNQNVEAVGRAWIKGEPLDAGAAMRGLIHMARNGPPAGTQFTGPAAQVFAVVKAEVDAESAPKAGQPLNAFSAMTQQNAGTVAEKERALIQRIQSKVGATYNGSILNGVVARTPELAKHVTVNGGQPHPISRIDPQVWNAAVHAGDQKGLEHTARLIGLSPQDFQTMINAKGGPIWDQVKAGKTGNEANFGHWEKTLNAQQTRAFMDVLDANVDRNSIGGVRPSQAYAGLMLSNKWRQVISNETKIDRHSSFAGYVTSQAGAGNVDGAYSNMADTVVRTFNGRRADIMTRVAERSNALRNDPLERTRYMLGAIDGLGPRDEAALLNYVKTLVPRQQQNGSGLGSNPLGLPQPLHHFQESNDAIDSFILSGKSDNPEIERIRRTVSKQWSQVKAIAGRAHDNYFQGE